MPVDLMIALVAATAVLVAIPGPNVALIVANTLERGTRFGVVTVLGTTVGIALQLALVVLGLGALLYHAADLFAWLKWLGVLYLIYLGVQAWRQGDEELAGVAPSRQSPLVVFGQGLGMALLNPKTLLFSAAFLPQFIPSGADARTLALAATIHLCVMLLGDLGWVVLAGSARRSLRRLGRLRHRLTGGFFLLSALGLSLARVER